MFAFVMFSCVTGSLLVSLVMIVMRNKEEAIYDIMGNSVDLHASPIKIFLVLVTLEVILFIDCTLVGGIIVVSIYLACFTIQFWLNQIWLVQYEHDTSSR